MASSQSSAALTTPPEPKTSKLFNSPTADVIFISSDGVLFRLHASHLNLNSVGFGRVSDNTIIGTEPVPLEEDSYILDILFQFIEPPPESRNFRQPSVMHLPAKKFFVLAEAAEKYVVFAATSICFTRMQQLVSDYPLNVLNHSVKHGYPDLADEAALKSLLLPLNKVASTLTAPGLLQRYMIYLSKYQNAAQVATMHFENMLLTPMVCPLWTHMYAAYRRQIDHDLLLIDTIPPMPDNLDDFDCPDDMCECVGLRLEFKLPSFLEKFTNLPPRIAKFSTIPVQ